MVGRQVVDQIAGFLASLPDRPVASGESPAQVRALLGDRPLPADGAPTADLLRAAADLIFGHSVLNSHPRFWGYITASPAPIGILADLLAAGVNATISMSTRSWRAIMVGATWPARRPIGCKGGQCSERPSLQNRELLKLAIHGMERS